MSNSRSLIVTHSFAVCILALLSWLRPAFADGRELQIFFTSEILGYLREDSRSAHAGIGTISHTVKELTRPLSPDRYMIFDLGDALSYYYLSQVDSGRTVFAAMDQGGYDATVPGNFDFTYGWQNLRTLNASAPRLRILSANVCDSLQQPVLPPYQILDRQGVRIAVVGLSDPVMAETVAERNLQGTELVEPEQAMTTLETELQGRYDLLIVLTHLNFNQNLQLSRACKKIDLIIGRPDENAPREYARIGYGGQRKRTIIIQAPANAKAVGHLSFRWHDGVMFDITMVEENLLAPTLAGPGISNMSELEKKYDILCQQRFGHGADEKVALVDSAAFEKEIVRQYLAAMLKSTHSEIALINRGYFRFYPLPDGKLTIRDVDRFGWSNDHLCIMRLRGSTLKSLQQKSEALPPDSKRRLYFMSVQNHTLDDNASWTVHSKDLLDEEEYAVVTNQFLSTGADGYDEFRERRFIKSRFKGGLRIVSDRQGREILVNELFLKFLVADSTRDLRDTAARFARDRYLNKPLWRLVIQQIDLGMSNKRVQTSEAYQFSPESRINEQLSGSHTYNLQMNVGITRESRNIQWQNALWAVYSNTTVKPKDSEPLTAQESNLEWTQLADFANLTRPRLLNPFASLRFDSDVDFNQRDLFTSLGMKVGTSGDAELRIAAISKWNAITRSTSNGLEMNGAYNKELLGISNEGWLRMRFLSGKDDAMPEQERYSVEWRNSFKIPISENMSFIPQLELFYYKGQEVPDVARNVQISFSLSYSRIWKFQYQKFYRKEDPIP